MNQEIVQHTQNLPSTQIDLAAWARSADAAARLAVSIVGTSFVPSAFRNKPEEAAAAILAGAEVGLSPLASLRAFDVIQGAAAPRAITLRAVAQSIGCEFRTVEESPREVVMEARRLGGEWERVEWTIERAGQMGLTGKDNWKRQPQSMLVARATSDLARRVAADAIMGLGYSAEEVQDTPELWGQSPEPAASSATIIAKAESAPEPVATVAEVLDAEVVAEPASAQQVDAIRRLVAELSMTNAGAGEHIRQVAKRADASTKNLTAVEAEAVIESLQALVVEAAPTAEEPEQGALDGMTAAEARAFVKAQADNA